MLAEAMHAAQENATRLWALAESEAKLRAMAEESIARWEAAGRPTGPLRVLEHTLNTTLLTHH